MKFSLIIWVLLGQLIFVSMGRSEDVAVLHLKHGAGLTEAKLHYLPETKGKLIKAVLVLCPGANGQGDRLLNDFWINYANNNELGLVGLSFESDLETLKAGSGYYYPNSGSGGLLINALRTIYGRDLPIILYGFSGGAHFVSRFVEAYPESVLTWCAYSFGWWDEPLAFQSKAYPPGILACGDNDYARRSQVDRKSFSISWLVERLIVHGLG